VWNLAHEISGARRLFDLDVKSDNRQDSAKGLTIDAGERGLEICPILRRDAGALEEPLLALAQLDEAALD